MAPVPTLLRPRLRVLATLLAGVLASGSVALLGPAAPATAAGEGSCQTGLTLGMQARQAQAVFTGEVTSVEVERRGEQRGVELVHTVAVDRVYNTSRVTVSAEVTVRTTRNVPDSCDLGRLPEGDSFIFFVRGVDGEDAVFTAAGDSGTTRRTNDALDQVERIYPTSQAPVPPSSTEAEFAVVEGVEAPLTLSRAAAPGAAMVLVGLLGLVVFRPRRRRR